MSRPCLHFVGFKDPRYEKDERYWQAVKVFGRPDFLHRGWDLRAKQEIAEGDTIIFAKGTSDQEPSVRSYDDSAHL